jgi:hypothetical protein
VNTSQPDLQENIVPILFWLSPIPLPSGERGRVRGQIAVRKNVKLPFRLRRYCFHPHSRTVGYSTAFFINITLSTNNTELSALKNEKKF